MAPDDTTVGFILFPAYAFLAFGGWNDALAEAHAPPQRAAKARRAAGGRMPGTSCAVGAAVSAMRHGSMLDLDMVAGRKPAPIMQGRRPRRERSDRRRTAA